ncbi:MAG TPA: TFIIB-type zinc finger domain-containing protein [Ktedonobacterales bacterium]|nr:TFIIB-type zinc finger domain-containing protein [Ktedonobacterales bacterium]
MGNGQNRNRRGGSRTRRGPHRGGAGGERHGATHVMPNTPASLTDGDESSDESPVDVELAEPAGVTDDTTSESPAETVRQAVVAEVAEIAEERFEREAGELRGGPPGADLEPGIEVAAAPELPAPPANVAPPMSDATPNPEGADLAQERNSLGAEPAGEPPSGEPERRAPRGRFERFYAPGQGPRVEQNGHTVPAVVGPARRPLRDSAASYEPQTPDDDDDDAAASSGPREDVRGSVGGLIDELHVLFTHDRSVASQGAVARCGICYFHFPVGELIYREAEGFYVCRACGRALGSERVAMVRRQQRL